MAADSSSVAASSSPPNWWDLHPSTSLSSGWHQPPNPHSCHDEVSAAPSFTNASSHDHHDQWMGDATSDNHIWRHVLSSAGNIGQTHSSQNIGESLLDTLSSFDKLSHNMVTNWSIAPPDSLDLFHVQQRNFTTSGFRVENERQEIESVPAPFHPTNGIMGCQIGSNTWISGDENKYHYGMHNSPRNLSDAISFSARLGKPLINNNIRGPKPYLKALPLSDNVKKQAQQISSPARTNGGRENDVNEGKKKRISQDNSETVLKKTKQERSLTTKVPKVKLAEKITALQQIVSPFGKTDTASVLYEAIGYIKFLQEQVQLLTNPYMKTNSNKYEGAWGGMDGEYKGDELRRRGLCLVPVSCTPQVCREKSSGSEYWTPAYRGCLYR